MKTIDPLRLPVGKDGQILAFDNDGRLMWQDIDEPAPDPTPWESIWSIAIREKWSEK